MRIARKVALLAVLATAAMAMSASSASAVTVTLESTGTACSAVTTPTHGAGSGGCLIRAVSNGQVELGSPAGMILCDNAFEARVNGTGSGFIYGKTLTNCNVPTVPCAEAGAEDPWPVTLTSTMALTASFCVVINGALTANCTNLSVDVSEQVNHDPVVFRTGTPTVHRNCTQAGISVSGQWTSVIDAGHPAVEIN